MNLRIQQGRLRGRRVPAPPEIKGQAHFTPALLKEAAFQIFDNHYEPDETVFFDLCAGSGQMGFEAFSRGYKSVVFAEVDPGRVALLRKTADSFREAPGSAELIVLRRDLRRMASRIVEVPRAAIFLDPPYSFWDEDGCSPVADLLEACARQGPEAGGYLFVVQGPEPLPVGKGSDVPVPEIRRHGNHYLSVAILSP